MSESKALAQACYQQLWQNDHASQHLGIEMQQVDEGHACITMSVKQFMLNGHGTCCLLYTSPSPRDRTRSRMPPLA